MPLIGSEDIKNTPNAAFTLCSGALVCQVLVAVGYGQVVAADLRVVRCVARTPTLSTCTVVFLMFSVLAQGGGYLLQAGLHMLGTTEMWFFVQGGRGRDDFMVFGSGVTAAILLQIYRNFTAILPQFYRKFSATLSQRCPANCSVHCPCGCP